MNITKLIALILSLCLSLCLLAGCGEAAETDAGETDTEQAAESREDGDDAGSAEDAAEEDAEPVASIDYDAAQKAFDPDQVVAKVDGKDILWTEVYYWLHYIISYDEYFSGGQIDWDEGAGEGMSLEDYYKDYAVKGTVYYTVVTEKAEENGVSVTAEQEQQIQNSIDSYAEQYGGQEGFEHELAASYMTLDLYKYFSEVACLHENLSAKLFGENGEKLSAEQVQAFIDEQGFYGAKHILINADETDPDGARAKAQEVLDKLNAGEDFDKLMNEYSEDPGLMTNPDGYVAMRGSMVPEFEDAALALEPGQHSDLVESSFGYHIIMRTDIDENSIPMEYADEGMSLRALAADDAFSKQLDEWLEAADLQLMPEFEKLKLSEIFVLKDAE
ncbi:MAG: peptidylprolyl isomerase [Oscillospiraceae bacterium]|nr:peptidylprolyl isomerase [Oscillospiraceae bacterium]